MMMRMMWERGFRVRLLALLLSLLMLLSACAAKLPDDGESSGLPDGNTSEDSVDIPNADEDLPALKVVDVSKAMYTYTEMEEDLMMLAGMYPTLLSVRSLGQSLDKREIYCAVVGSPDAEKQIVIHGGIHAREYMTSLLVMKQLEYYLAEHNTAEYKGKTVKEWFSEYCIYVVPMSNPDGVTISQYGSQGIRDEMLRKTLRDIYESDASYGFATTSSGEVMDFETYLRYWKANARGVDLNRNYDAGWEEYHDIISPCFRGYKGTAPESEPETKAMVSLVNSLPNLVTLISMHAQGNVLYWDCGQEDTEPGSRLVHAIQDMTGYTVIYAKNNDASLNDWVILKKGLPSVTVEIGNVKCPLPIDQFDSIWEECRDLWLLLAELYSVDLAESTVEESTAEG